MSTESLPLAPAKLEAQPRGFGFTLLAPAIIVGLALLAQWAVNPLLGDYLSRVMLDVGVAILMGVSLNIVNGYTGQFSLGHAAFFAIGGYVAAGITYYLSIATWNSAALHDGLVNAQSAYFLLATLVGGVVAAGAGWLVGLPSLRLRGDYLAIVTLGFGEIVRVLLQQTNAQRFSREELSATSFSELVPPPMGASLGFINIPNITLNNYFWTALAVGLCVLFAWRLKKSTFGRAMIAIRENEVAAEAMGVNITKLKVRAFVFASFFAGIAGSLYAHTANQIAPGDSGITRSTDAVIIVVLGGLGSISGAVLAAILVTVASEWLRDPTQPLALGGVSVEIWWLIGLVGLVRVATLIGQNRKLVRSAIIWTLLTAGVAFATYAGRKYGINLGDYRMIIYALVLIVVMIGRPSGLFGTSEITDLFRRKPKAVTK